MNITPRKVIYRAGLEIEIFDPYPMIVFLGTRVIFLACWVVRPTGGTKTATQLNAGLDVVPLPSPRFQHIFLFFGLATYIQSKMRHVSANVEPQPVFRLSRLELSVKFTSDRTLEQHWHKCVYEYSSTIIIVNVYIIYQSSH